MVQALQILEADKQHRIKALLAVQVDTASGVVNDVPRLRKLLDDTDHPALLMIDCIASLGTMAFEMDEWGVDVAVAGSQKGLMLPPGLAFTAASDKAKAAHKNADLRTHYWDWTFRDGPEHYMKYCGTPPEHLLFGLKCALDMLLAEGLPGAFKRHQLLADAVRSAVTAWGGNGLMRLNVEQTSARANSVTAIELQEGRSPQTLLDWCEHNAAVKLGITIGDLQGKGFRIGHMGYVNAPMVLGVLGVWLWLVGFQIVWHLVLVMIQRNTWNTEFVCFFDDSRVFRRKVIAHKNVVSIVGEFGNRFSTTLLDVFCYSYRFKTAHHSNHRSGYKHS